MESNGKLDHFDNTHIVGDEKSLKDLLTESEVMTLLDCAVEAGISEVMVTDSEGEILWRHAGHSGKGDFTENLSLYIEGEVAGNIVIKAGEGGKGDLRKISRLLHSAVNLIATNNLKRILTSDIHTTVVQQSYEELLEINRKLSESEARYRELAEHLEKKVVERTDELKQAHARLLQQEKMASIGQLAAGVAHEINNPLSYISSNMSTLKRYTAKIREMIESYRGVEVNEMPEKTRERLSRKWRELKLNIIFDDMPDLIEQSMNGAERVTKIVADLKGFSHVDDSEEGVVDINKELDRTLNVLGHEIPEDAGITRNYRPLPGFVCNPALICQVFLNIILNSLDARQKGLKLAISTECTDDLITITFADNGPGMPEEVSRRIFEPFFTTKDVGKGTGMGLAVAYDIVNTYGGTIEVESRPGEGSTFTITMPVKKKRTEGGEGRKGLSFNQQN